MKEKLEKLINENEDLQTNLNLISDFLKDNYNIDLYFCEIFGNRRWSFFAGSEDVIAQNKKIKINQNLGIIIDNYSQIDESKWKEIVEFVESLI